MTTIDKLDISVYQLYAMRTRMIEQINQQLHLEEAASIPPQTQVVMSQAQLTELDILLGVLPMWTPWAYFFPPKKYRTLRRSPFSFSKVAPSIGSDEKESDEDRLLEVACSGPDEEQEKQAILSCLKQLDKINDWLGFIVGRVGQFLQG